MAIVAPTFIVAVFHVDSVCAEIMRQTCKMRFLATFRTDEHEAESAFPRTGWL